MRVVRRSVCHMARELSYLCLLRLNQDDPDCCLSLVLFRFISIPLQDQENRVKLVSEEFGLTPKQIISDG